MNDDRRVRQLEVLADLAIKYWDDANGSLSWPGAVAQARAAFVLCGANASTLLGLFPGRPELGQSSHATLPVVTDGHESAYHEGD